MGLLALIGNGIGAFAYTPTPEPKDQLFFRSAEAEAAAKARDLKSRCSKSDMRIGASPTGFDARRVASRASPALDLVH
jgi:hypothetical protein